MITIGDISANLRIRERDTAEGEITPRPPALSADALATDGTPGVLLPTSASGRVRVASLPAGHWFLSLFQRAVLDPESQAATTAQPRFIVGQFAP